MHGIKSAKRFMPRLGCCDARMPEFRKLSRVTLMPIISASGACAPPLFVFKGSWLPYRTFIRDGNVVTQTPLCNIQYGPMAVTREGNGGIDTPRFLDWGYSFVEHVEPLTRGGRKVLLIYYGYRAHLSLAVLDLFHKNNIIVYVLPSHTSGKTQPLDVVLFTVLRTVYRMQLAAVQLLVADGTMIYLIFVLLFEMLTTGPLQ